MAQNHNGSEPFVACGEKGQKVMWSMGCGEKAIGFGIESLV